MSDVLTQFQPPGFPGGILYGNFAKPPAPVFGQPVVIQTYVAEFHTAQIMPANLTTELMAPAELT